MSIAQELLKARREINTLYIELVPIGNGKTMAAIEAAIEALDQQHKILCCDKCGMYRVGQTTLLSKECKC